MAKQLIQVIIAGTQVVGKAFMNAVKQEIRNAIPSLLTHTLIIDFMSQRNGLFQKLSRYFKIVIFLYFFACIRIVK